MKLPIFTKSKNNESVKSFADFFLHAPQHEKKRILTDAAKRSNKDQRAIIKEFEAHQGQIT